MVPDWRAVGHHQAVSHFGEVSGEMGALDSGWVMPRMGQAVRVRGAETRRAGSQWGTYVFKTRRLTASVCQEQRGAR